MDPPLLQSICAWRWLEYYFIVVLFLLLMQALSANEADYSTERHMLTFPQHVSPNKSLRDASVAAEKKLSDFGVEMRLGINFSRKDQLF